MVLLGDEAQVEAKFGPFGDSASLDSRQVHGLCRMYHRLRNWFVHTRWNSQVTWACGILFRSIWRQCQCQCKIGAWFAPNIPQNHKSFWTHPMVLLGDEAQVEAQFGPFGDSANFDARQVHDLRQTYHRLKNQFGHTRWNSQVMWIMWNLISVYLVIVLVLVQDTCMVCAEHTIGSKIIWDAANVTPR